MTKVFANRIYKFIYAMLIVALFFQSIIIFSPQQFKPKSLHDIATFDFEQEKLIENGEEVMYNLISTPEQLAGALIAMSGENITNKVYAENYGTYFNSTNKYKLRNDIDLKNVSGINWNSADLSAGYTLEGNYKTIKNLRINISSLNVGFVGSNSGIIQNIFFENVQIKNNYNAGYLTNTGCVVAANFGTIKNVIVMSGSVSGNEHSTSDGNRSTGGIAGKNEGTIINCENRAAISFGNKVGGIVGYSTKGNISQCRNYGKVENCLAQYQRIGGIVGEITAGTLKKCINYSSISNTFKVKGDFTISNSSVGGISGLSKVEISECGNYGNVYAAWSYSTDSILICPKEAYAGGICGYSTSTFSKCFNCGDVTSYAEEKKDINTYEISYDEVLAYYGTSFMFRNLEYYYEPQDFSTTNGNPDGRNRKNNSIKDLRQQPSDYGVLLFPPYLTMEVDGVSFSEIINYSNSYIKKNIILFSTKDYANGIGYTTKSVSNCLNTGTINSGSNSSTTFEFKNIEFGTGYYGGVSASRGIVSMTLTFNAGYTTKNYISNSSNQSKCYSVGQKNLKIHSQKIDIKHYVVKGGTPALATLFSKTYEGKSAETIKHYYYDLLNVYDDRQDYKNYIETKNGGASVYLSFGGENIGTGDFRLNINREIPNVTQTKTIEINDYFANPSQKFSNEFKHEGALNEQYETSINETINTVIGYLGTENWGVISSGVYSGKPFLKSLYWQIR